MLDDVAAIDDARSALRQQALRSTKELLVADAAATANQHLDVAGDFQDAVVVLDVGGRICLDDVSAQLARAPRRAGLP